MRFVFLTAIAAQIILGLWRARILGAAVTPALALAALIALVALLWFLKRDNLPGAPLANFAALLAATAGVLSAISAANAPFIGTVARISVPLFAFSIAALLAVARLEDRFVRIAAITFLVALALLEYDLWRDARWETY
jgi:hypothetical protein